MFEEQCFRIPAALIQLRAVKPPMTRSNIHDPRRILLWRRSCSITNSPRASICRASEARISPWDDWRIGFFFSTPPVEAREIPSPPSRRHARTLICIHTRIYTRCRLLGFPAHYTYPSRDKLVFQFNSIISVADFGSVAYIIISNYAVVSLRLLPSVKYVRSC